MFMTTTDATIVNILIPQLQTSIGLSPDGMHWVMSIYVLLFGGLMLLGGRLTDVLGRRPVFLAGLTLFTLGSVLAATAQDEAQLLVARAVQGIGAAGMAPGALSILVTSFPDPLERNKAFGVWGTIIGVGASVGTILGGALAEIGWRWAFSVNIPVGLALAVATVLLVRPGVPTRPRPPADLLGALTATVGLLLLVYGIASTTTHGWTDAARSAPSWWP
jgi:MFS family permease